MQINLTDKYQTRSGLPVRILCLDLKGTAYPVAVAAHLITLGREKTYCVSPDGKFAVGLSEYDLDIIPVPKFQFIPAIGASYLDSQGTKWTILLNDLSGDFQVLAYQETRIGKKEIRRFTHEGYYHPDKKDHDLNLIAIAP